MNRQPDRNRLRALDGVEPPDQWDDIVLRADSDLPRLQLRPAHTSHRLLVAAVVLVLAGVAGALVMSTSTGDRGEPEVVAADGGSTPAFPAGGGDAPGSDATTPDGMPVPTTAPDGSDGGGDGSGSGSNGSSGSGSQGGGSSGSGTNNMRTTTTVASDGTTTTVVGPTTTAPSTATTVTAPTETDAGGEAPTDRLLSVDARTEGELSLVVCNRIAATAVVDGDRLVVSLGSSAGQSCGEPLDGHEAFLTAFFDNDPTFVTDGNRLVLTVGNRRVELTPY